MKFQMAKNSLFAVLLRKPWWVSMGAGVGLGVVGVALLPGDAKVAGALWGVPFFVIGLIALWRQWGLPSAARIEQTRQAVSGMNWQAFSALLVQGFERDGHAVTRRNGEACDFELAREGKRTLVSARRWKGARAGLDVLRALQDAREREGVTHAVFIGLAPLSDTAAPYAAQHGIDVWQEAELAHALRGLPLTAVR